MISTIPRYRHRHTKWQGLLIFCAVLTAAGTTVVGSSSQDQTSHPFRIQILVPLI